MHLTHPSTQHPTPHPHDPNPKPRPPHPPTPNPPPTTPTPPGTYFKGFSDPASISETVAASDALVFVGVHFNEMSWPTVPDSATHARSVILYKSRAVLALTRAFTLVPAGRLLPALAARVKGNAGALELFRSLPRLPPALPASGADFTAPEDAPLKTKQVGGLVMFWGWGVGWGYWVCV